MRIATMLNHAGLNLGPELAVSHKCLKSVMTNSMLPYTGADAFCYVKPYLHDLHAPAVSESFGELALRHASDLWATETGPLNLLWSGGIDSTAALVALIKTKPYDAELRVWLTGHSIQESKHMYLWLLEQTRERTLPGIYLGSSYDIVSVFSHSSGPVITGECGDQLFGSDINRAVGSAQGPAAIHAPYKDVLVRYFTAKTGSADLGRKFIELYEPICAWSPMPIRTTQQFLWWWNFTQKWFGVCNRILSFLPQEHREVWDTRLYHFYESASWRAWSVTGHAEGRLTMPDWTQYKAVARDWIVQQTGVASYATKAKVGSLFHILAMRPSHVVIYEDYSSAESPNRDEILPTYKWI